MATTTDHSLLRDIRGMIVFFIISIVISGITTFPIETELAWMQAHADAFPECLRDWINQVYAAVRDTNAQYPYLAYGTDWLAFAHLIIAIAFVGPLRDPVKNKWIIQWGMICCLCVFPLAFIAGAIRGVPVCWRLVDCSFGVVGGILLFYCYRKIRRLELLQS